MKRLPRLSNGRPDWLDIALMAYLVLSAITGLAFLVTYYLGVAK